MAIQRMTAKRMMELGPGHPEVRLYTDIRLEEEKSYWSKMALQREAYNTYQDSKKAGHEWLHVYMKRFYGNTDRSYECMWIMLRPEDYEKARVFQSFSTFSKYMKEGDTILVLPDGRWNILLDRDEVLDSMLSTKMNVTKWEMERRSRETMQTLGIV